MRHCRRAMLELWFDFSCPYAYLASCRAPALAAALRGSGVSGDDIALALRDGDAKKDELRQRTDEAISLGIFGAPAWVIRRDRKAHERGPRSNAGGVAEVDQPILVWGQDRMDWVRAIWRGWDPERDAHPAPTDRIEAKRELDVYFDVASPFAYLGLTQLARYHARPRLHPILLGALFRDIGQVDVPLYAMPDAKQRYITQEMTRWARWWNV